MESERALVFCFDAFSTADKSTQSAQIAMRTGADGACHRARIRATRWLENALTAARIIRGFAGDGDVVDVALTQARAGDAYELRLLVELGEVSRADIAHRRAKPAGELMHDVADRALVGHLALDALRHQFERVLDILLEVAVGRAARHRADRAHAAIGLVGAAL